MAKSKKEKQDEAPPEAAGPAKYFVPAWAAIVAGIMLVAGAIVYFTHDSRRHGAAVEALNTARVLVENLEDGLSTRFAVPVVQSNARPYMEVLGASHTDPVLALDVFREVVQRGSYEGRVLAVRLGYHLIRDGKIGEAERAEVLQTIGGLVESDQKDVACVAQWALGKLLAAATPEQGRALAKLPDKPKESKSAWAIKSEERKIGNPGAEESYAEFRWSDPEACAAWWKLRSAKAAWDAKLNRFVVSGE